MPMNARAVFLSLAVVSVGASGCIASISDAVRSNAELLPQPQYVLLPMTTNTKLGRLAGTNIGTAEQLSRRITVSPTPCFFVSVQEDSGPSDIEINYTSSQDISAELTQINTNIGGGAAFEHANKAQLRLKGIKTRKGLGVPDLNSGCRQTIENGETILVITSETYAESISLDYEDATKAKLKASGVIPQGGLKIGGELQTQVGEDGSIVAKGVVFGGQLTPITAFAKKSSHDLGATPPVGKRIEFPEGFDGNLTVKSFDASSNKLTIQVSAALLANATAPAGLKTCPTGKDYALGVGDRCDFWLSSGSSLISVQWNRDGDRVVVAVDGYGSNFTLNPALKNGVR